MPTPTTQITFGSTIGGVYCIVELDTEENKNDSDEEVTLFLDTETVNILVHHEPGVVIERVLGASKGSIVNAQNPQLVTRTKTIDTVVFKSTEEADGYDIPHFPVGGITAEWVGLEGVLSIEGRKVSCSVAPRVANLTYTYQAYQYRLEVPDLNIEEDDQFYVDVSFEVVRG